MRCPRCGAENPESARFCNLCFYTFSPGSVAAQAADAPDWESAPPPPGYGPPPPITVPPPSDAYAPGGPYTAAPPPMQLTKPSTVKTVMTGLLSFFVFVACFAGGWYLTGRIMKGGSSTYTSTSSDISFKYPSRWRKVDPGSIEKVASLAAGDLSMYNEIILGEGSGASPVNFLAVGNLPIAQAQWDSARAGIKEAFVSQMTLALPDGINVSTPVFTDLEVGGSPALSIRFNLTGEGLTYGCDATVVQHGSWAYMFVFMSHQAGGSPEKFQDVLDSVKFKGSGDEGAGSTG